jgi:hypothetical protein
MRERHEPDWPCNKISARAHSRGNWQHQPEQRGPAIEITPVRVNDDLTLDFDDRHLAQPGHYAFLVDDATFDATLDRLRRSPSIDYGSAP